MLKSVQIEESYQDLISMMVFDINNKGYMFSNVEIAKSKYEDICEEIIFAQWITTDRIEIINQTLPVNGIP